MRISTNTGIYGSSHTDESQQKPFIEPVAGAVGAEYRSLAPDLLRGTDGTVAGYGFAAWAGFQNRLVATGCGPVRGFSTRATSRHSASIARSPSVATY